MMLTGFKGFAKGFVKAISIISACSAFASTNPPKQDRNAILAFAGCYRTTYNFVETFALQPGYKLHSPYYASGIEWVAVDRDDAAGISLQHILLTSMGPQKHWRQEWTYRASSLFEYHGNDTWVKTPINAAAKTGEWAQRVYQVDDSPQYECSAPWVQWDRHRYWECEAWSPLPRREYTHRSDYNVLIRRNRQELTSFGWRHEQDNQKVIATGGALTHLVKEKGENRYERVDDSLCKDARVFWEQNRDVWHAIQLAWAEVYARHDKIHLVHPGGQPVLFERLFDFADKARTTRLNQTEIRNEAEAIIESYISKS